jgi:glycosyltransferase involved in cell wall biosynthesis
MQPPKRLKIAFVIDSYDGIKTGGVFSAQRFINALSIDHDITLVTTGKEDPSRVIMKSFYPPFFKGLMQKMGFVFAWPDTKKLTELFSQVDIVHVQFPWLLGLRAIKIAKKMGVPVVTGFHMQPENILLNIKLRSQFLSEQIYRFFINSFFNKSDGVICPSDFALKELKNRGLKAKPIVISNGLTKDFRPIEAVKKPEYQDKFLILVVGRLAREKRVDILIKAIANSKYKDKIQMVATGRGPMKETWEEMGKYLPNPAKFLFVSHEDLINLFNTADLYVHTSEVELEGMAVLEAIGCGLPAIISINSTSASSQFALDENFGFQDADYFELAKKIDFLIENPEILMDAKKKYREMALKFNLEESVKLTEDFYFNTIKVIEKQNSKRGLTIPQILET